MSTVEPHSAKEWTHEGKGKFLVGVSLLWLLVVNATIVQAHGTWNTQAFTPVSVGLSPGGTACIIKYGGKASSDTGDQHNRIRLQGELQRNIGGNWVVVNTFDRAKEPGGTSFQATKRVNAPHGEGFEDYRTFIRSSASNDQGDIAHIGSDLSAVETIGSGDFC
jgi:hypothetical protein